MGQQQDIPSSVVKTTILIVDDELPIIKLCKALLEAAGFTVLEAEGSSEALKIFAQHDRRIDLLLTDLILPPPHVFSLAPPPTNSLVSMAISWPFERPQSEKASE